LLHHDGACGVHLGSRHQIAFLHCHAQVGLGACGALPA
jgi:hypothetical protein